MKKKIIVFDMDGTLVDSRSIVFQAFKDLAIELNYDAVSDQDLARLRTVRSKDFLKVLDVPLWKGYSLKKRIEKYMEPKMAELTFVDGMTEVLLSLKEKDHVLGVATSNSNKNMKLFFEKYKGQFFDFKHANVFPFTKHFELGYVARFFNADIKDVWYIGDETRDVLAAKKVGANAIAVTWGFNDEKILREMNPDFVAKTPSEILDILDRA